MLAEGRSIRRYRSLKSAQLVDSQTGTYINVTVLDLNSRGARVRLPRMPQTMGPVELILLPEKVKVFATPRWLRGNQCGLEFKKPLRYLEKHDVCARNSKSSDLAVNLPVS